MKFTKFITLWALVLVLTVGTTGLAAAQRDHKIPGDLLREAMNVLLKGSTYTESVDMMFDVASGGALSLGTTNGSIKVFTWDKEKIRLVITKTTRAASAFDARALLAMFVVQTKCEGKDLQLLAKAQTKECKQTVGVTFNVWVPRSYNVDVKTETGHIDIGKINGSFSAYTSDGKITLGYDPDDGLDIEVEDRTADQDDLGASAPVMEDSGEQKENNSRIGKTEDPTGGIGKKKTL